MTISWLSQKLVTKRDSTVSMGVSVFIYRIRSVYELKESQYVVIKHGPLQLSHRFLLSKVVIESVSLK